MPIKRVFLKRRGKMENAGADGDILKAAGLGEAGLSLNV